MPENHPKDAETMTDAVLARGVIDGLWPIEKHGRKRVIGYAFEAIKRVERALPTDVIRQRPRQWTERRIRSIVDEEIRGVDHYEMADLERMAIREGRREFQASVQRAARLAAFLASTDEGFFGPEIDRLGEFLSRVDRSRDSGADR